jgi:hypothetical protein
MYQNPVSGLTHISKLSPKMISIIPCNNFCSSVLNSKGIPACIVFSLYGGIKLLQNTQFIPR